MPPAAYPREVHQSVTLGRPEMRDLHLTSFLLPLTALGGLRYARLP